MWLQTARTISDRLHAAHDRAIAGLRRIPIRSILVFATAIAWLVGAGWWNYVRTQEYDFKSYERYQEQLAECRELIELYDPTSGNLKQLNSMLAKIAERRAQLEQQMLDIHQMQLELDTAQERCEQALAATLNNKDNR